MKKSIKITIGAAAAVLVGLTGFCAWFLSDSGSTRYYTRTGSAKKKCW